MDGLAKKVFLCYRRRDGNRISYKPNASNFKREPDYETVASNCRFSY